MKLHGILLDNFRQHADSSVFFPPKGVTGIIGTNESGKSSILEAVAWALYGARATRGAKAGLRWNRAPARHVARARLVFEIDGETYHIDRSESNAQLTKVSGTGAVIASGTSAVDGYVPGLIGMELAEFEASYLCRQKDLSRLAGMGPTERRQFFLEVMGIGRVDHALADCRARKNELRAERDGLAAGLGDGAGIQVELASAEDAAETAESEHRAAVEADDRALGATDEQRMELRRSSEIRRLRESTELALTSARERVATIEGQRARVVQQREAAYAASAELEREGDVVGQLQAASGRAEELRHSRLEEQSRLRGESKVAARAMLDLSSGLDRLSQEGREGTCPLCARALGDHFDQVIGDLEESHALVQARESETRRRAEELAAPGADELAAGSEVERLKALDRSLTEARRLAAGADHLGSELDRCSEELTAAQVKVDMLEAELRGLPFDAAVHAELERAVEEARTDKVRAENIRAAAGERLLAARGRVQRAEKGIEEYRARAEHLKRFEAELQTHSAAAERLADFRSATAGAIRPELEELASGFVSLLTDGRHEAVSIDEGFNVTPYESGVPVDVVSGGTEDVVAIALRLAISQMIAERAGHPLSLLILDEPFGSLDEVRRGNVLALVRRLGGIFEQVLVISHVAETRDAVDHVLEVVYDEASGRATLDSSYRAEELPRPEAAA